MFHRRVGSGRVADHRKLRLPSAAERRFALACCHTIRIIEHEGMDGMVTDKTSNVGCLCALSERHLVNPLFPRAFFHV